jgi:hypothetical protein
MKRVLILVAALVALGAAAVQPARAATFVSSSCPYGSTVLASVNYTVTGEPLVGAAGNVWAIASYTQYVNVYRVGSLGYCAVTYSKGTFTTVAGTSPAGTGTIAGGITGTFTSGTRSTTFSGVWNPKAPTTGSIGSYSSGTIFLSLYFSSTSGYGTPWYAANFYTSLSCYSNSYLGIRNDILA